MSHVWTFSVAPSAIALHVRDKINLISILDKGPDHMPGRPVAPSAVAWHVCGRNRAPSAKALAYANRYRSRGITGCLLKIGFM
jgi:hypothetical protein